MKRLLWFSAATLLLFSGCSHSSDDTSHSPPSAEKKVAISEEGIITKKEITIFEDGTHFFVTDSGKQFILKSSIVDLSRHEDEHVRVTGERLETPPEGKIPVITVYSVEPLLQNSDIQESLFTESDHYFSASFPGNWHRELTNEGVLYYGPEESGHVVSVSIVDETSKEGIRLREDMADGAVINIGGKIGRRISESGGNTSLIVPLSERKKIALFRFVSGKNPETEKMVFYKMLTGLSWLEDEEGAETEEGESDPKTIIYCGGIAKKLCPSGYRCEFKSFEKDSAGVCADASLPPGDSQLPLKTETEEEIPSTNTPPSSVSAEPGSENTPPISLPEGFKEYRRERFSYSFAIPKSWWWEEKAADEVASRIVIATEEITDENQIISLDILFVPTQKRTEVIDGGVFSVFVPRDQETSFRVKGKKEYSEQIKNIASSLSSF